MTLLLLLGLMCHWVGCMWWAVSTSERLDAEEALSTGAMVPTEWHPSPYVLDGSGLLQWGHWVIPHWHAKYDRVAYWTKFGRPKITPTQGNQFTTGWVDATRNNALKGKLASANE